MPYFLESARDLEIIGLALGIVFWFQMLRRCTLVEQNSLAKFFWMVFMIVVPGVGSLIYYLVRVVKLRG